MDIQKVFADNLRRYRKAAHLSQEELAELVGMHRTYIGGIEQRRVNISLKNINRIAEALHIDPALLLIAPKSSAEFYGIAQRQNTKPKSPSAEAPKAASVQNVESTASPSYTALISWNGSESVIEPIKRLRVDLTSHVICDLLQCGYTGHELVSRYDYMTTILSDLIEGE